MKRLLLLLLIAPALYAQGVRVPIQVTQQITVAGVSNVVGIPAAPTVAFCNSPANAVPCTNKATTYTDATLTTPCSTSTQIVLDGTSTCVANLNSQNQGGVWVVAAQYAYTISYNGSNFGPFFVTAGLGVPAPASVSISGATCTLSGIAAQVATIAVAGTVDARACTTAFTWGSTLTISQPMTLYMPCANVTFTAQLLNIISDDVHIHFCGSGTSGQVFVSNNSGSTYTASGLGSTVDAITAMKTSGRVSSATARISGITIDGLSMNMNSVGRRAIYLSTCWSCRLDDIVVTNQNCSDGGIYQEADPAADGTIFAASYFTRMTNIVSAIVAGNTTCHPFEFDASNGEIAYGVYTNLFGWGPSTGAGSDQIYVNTGATSVNQSFDQNVFVNIKTQDAAVNAYGIKLQCRGNFLTGTNGRCFSNTFIDPQPERIFTGASGVGIGCVNGSGGADGTGCGGNYITTWSGAGFSTNIDYANMGDSFVSCPETNTQTTCRMTGIIAGGSQQLLRLDHTFTPTASSQNLFSMLIVPNVNKGGVGVTGTQLFVGPNCDMGDATVTGTGTVSLGSCFNCNTATWATINYCYSGNGTFNFVEGSAPNVVASSDNCGGVASTHSFQCSFNGDGPFTLARDITAISSAFATATTAGTCVQNVTAVTGAATSMSVSISPVSTPGVGAVWSAFVSSAGNVTINECAVATSAGGTIAFNIRVIP